MDKTTRHLRIHGRVQGVFFRESMRQKASELAVTGWVRNRFDGSVEAMIQGSPENVENMTEWARTGPAGAHVQRVEAAEAEGDFTGFERLPTA